MHGSHPDFNVAIILAVVGTFVFVGTVVWIVVMERADEKDRKGRRK